MAQPLPSPRHAISRYNRMELVLSENTVKSARAIAAGKLAADRPIAQNNPIVVLPCNSYVKEHAAPGKCAPRRSVSIKPCPGSATLHALADRNYGCSLDNMNCPPLISAPPPPDADDAELAEGIVADAHVAQDLHTPIEIKRAMN